MDDNKNSNHKKRRDFLRAGLLLGAGTVAGSVLKISGKTANAHETEKVKVLMADGTLAEVDKSALNCKIDPCEPPKGKEARKGIPGRKFAMVIDLGKCANARKCIEACQKGHDLTASQDWIEVPLMKENPDSEPYWFPKPCYHCDNPPCVKVCPVGATYKRSDGIVLVNTDRCIGCKFCISACPYSARIFNWGHRDVYKKDESYSPETSVPGQVGTVGKCDFCPDLSRKGKLPHCVDSCPMGALYFGDVNEDAITNGTETLRFKKTLKEKAGYRFMEELGTKPNVYYLPAVNKTYPYENGLETLSEEHKDRMLDNISKTDR